MTTRQKLERINLVYFALNIAWFVGFGTYALTIWNSDPLSHDALKYNLLAGALFGVPWFVGFLMRLTESFGRYRTLHLTGSDIFKFDQGMDDFVAHHARRMRGAISFYNIPLQTFSDTRIFKKIWRDAIGKNNNISEVRLLLDESMRNQWKEVVKSHQDYFLEPPNSERFRVKFTDIRKKALFNEISLPPGLEVLRAEFQKILPFTCLNFGVWCGHDAGDQSSSDLVTMTAESDPWGTGGSLLYFLAVTEQKPLCQRIREFVVHQYTIAADPALSPRDFI